MKNLLFASLLAVLCSCEPGAPTAGSVSQEAATGSAPTNAVIENMLARRSIRKYKPQSIARDTLMQILRCGVSAPNGMHKESWQVRVVDDAVRLDSISRRMGAGAPGRHAFYNAPVAVFIACDTTYDLSQVDCGLLGGNMILAARSLGIGSCCLGGVVRYLNTPEASDLMTQLDLPETHRLLYAIVFGYPDEDPAAKTRDMGKVKFVDAQKRSM